MTLLVLMIILSAILCCFMNHPLTLGFILLLQTMMVALLTGMMSMNFWSSYIIFLIMIGGMLILFIYMTSIASNEKFKFSSKLFMFMTLFTILMTSTTLFLDKFLMSQKFKLIETFSTQENINIQLFLNKFINFPFNMIYMMMVIYLLITLIAIVKMSSKTKSPLRKNF
uniref:NADH-ubiquinone oxidoreductase chain 6 n=1 Tax=Cryptocephalus obliteratifer TaxID=1425556 RepID=A0A3G1GQD8_9CUCU|nr:NADH dehydrogenase subunit 6 [Cryptocephalus obliteratifer]